MENAEQRIRALVLEADRAHTNAREQAAALMREAEMHGVMATAYKKALAAFGESGDAEGEQTTPASQTVASKQSHTKGSGIPGGPKWASVFERMIQDGNAPYSYPDLEAAAGKAGYQISLGAIRAQMMNVVNEGLFDRISPGKFNITSSGLELIMAQQCSGPPKGDPESAGSTISAAATDRDANGDPIGVFS